MAKTNGLDGTDARAWRVFLSIGLLAAVGYALVPTQPAHNVYFSLVGVSTVAAILVGIRLNRPARPLPWYLILAGVSMLVIGDGIWNYYELVLGIASPFPAVPDVVYLSGYLVMAGGLVLFICGRTREGDMGSVIDATIIAVGVGVVSWVYLMDPYTEDASLSLVARLVSIAYPLMDVLFLALVVRLLFSYGTRPLSYYFLGASLALLLISDAIYAVAILNGTYYTGHPIDHG